MRGTGEVVIGAHRGPPTTQNSPIFDGMRVGRDAACVAVVRGAGALIMGKTDTVEFASGGRKALI
jgi:Asp-tRNA(Asn)/Glu-tRNA(Gln) amidotransferase A subunit family amidase